MSVLYRPPNPDPYIDRTDIAQALADRYQECKKANRPCRMYVHGLPGIGTSSVVYRFCRQTFDTAPIWLSGRQTDGRAVPAPELLAQVLRRLAPDAAEGTDSDMTQAYLNLTRGRRELTIVVDGLVDAAQIEHLDPVDASGVTVLATTAGRRRALDTQYTPFALAGLGPEHAAALFAARLGNTVLDDSTAHRLLAYADGSPACIEQFAAHIQDRPHVATRLVTKLAATTPRAFGMDDRLDLLYGELDEPGLQECYRRLGLLTGFEFDAATAAAALGGDSDEVADLLDELVDRDLIAAHNERYALPEPVSAHAYARACAEDDPQLRSEVVTRGDHPPGACGRSAWQGDHRPVVGGAGQRAGPRTVRRPAAGVR